MYLSGSNNKETESYRLNPPSKSFLWLNVAAVFFLFVSLILGSIFYFIVMDKEFGEVKLSLGFFLFKCFIVYIFSVFLHEMGHLVMVRRFGYQYRIFKSGGFLAINNSFRHLSFKPSQLLSSGFIMINFNEAINSRISFSRFIKKDYYYISFGGILFNFLLVAVGIIMMSSRKTIELGYILSFFNVMTIIAQLFHPSDLTKLWIIYKNPEKAAALFEEELSINLKVNRFIEELFNSYITTTLSNKRFDQHLLSALQRLIEYNLINQNENSKEITQFINWFTFNYHTIKKMGIVIRITSERLMHTIIEHKLSDDIEAVDYKLSPIARRHPFHQYYLNFSCYQNRLAAVEAIKKEGK